MDRRRTHRVTTYMPVRVWGMDAKALPFMQLARITNISTGGAVIEGMAHQIKPGQTVHVQASGGTAQFKVAWASGFKHGEIGIECLSSQPAIWNINPAWCAEFAGKG